MVYITNSIQRKDQEEQGLQVSASMPRDSFLGEHTKPSQNVNQKKIRSKKDALSNLEKAMDRVPNVQKAAYLEALKFAPHLIKTESNPVWFLDYDAFNYSAAALRLACYWKERREVFGDRAFLPLAILAGECVYDKEAMRALRNGSLVLLPNDSNGRTVIYHDDYKMRRLSVNVQTQLLFYLNFVAMRNPQSRKEGFVLLANVDSIACNDEANKIAINIGRRIMPMRVHSTHIFCKESLEGIFPIANQHSRCISNQTTYIHLFRTPEERADKLLPFGLYKERLPSFLGGSWEMVPNVVLASNRKESIQTRCNRVSCEKSTSRDRRIQKNHTGYSPGYITGGSYSTIGYPGYWTGGSYISTGYPGFTTGQAYPTTTGNNDYSDEDKVSHLAHQFESKTVLTSASQLIDKNVNAPASVGIQKPARLTKRRRTE